MLLSSLLPRRKPERHGEKDADWYDMTFAENRRAHYTQSPYYFIWAVIADRALRAGATSVLDVGCGTGQLGCLLKDIGLPRYHGFDFSPKRIEQARVLCPEFTFTVEDAYKTDLFETLDYDCVICTEFLEHISGDLHTIRRIKPGSRFLATVPNFPYVSHVRHFKDREQVVKRYAALFDDLAVDAFLANPKGSTFFLLEGVTLSAGSSAPR